MKSRADSIDLLNMTHDFPCPVMIKAIGKNEADFPMRIAWAIRDALGLEFDPVYRTREAQGGRHIAVTLEPTFDNAEQVLDLYDAIRKVEGVVMVM
jgi:putative lipoic acid-binding regulatory protein